MAYITGKNRYQIQMELECLDDIIDKNNEVRVIDAYVNSLKLSTLGFLEYPANTVGQQPYDRKDLLKLHIYGYMNKIRSSRCLEKESYRNTEIMWLVNNIHPDHNTISNFVRDNKTSFKKVLKNLVSLLRDFELIDDAIHVVDGTKIKAVNSQKRYLTIKKIDLKLGDLEKSINAYTEEIEEDNNDQEITINVSKIIEKLSKVTKRKEELETIKTEMMINKETQRTFTDSDCRGMKNNGKVEPCYNVQTLVDGKNKLIIDCEATNDINDQAQLTNLTIKNNIKDGIVTMADLGYFNIAQIIECVNNNMDLYINRPRPNNTQKDDGYRKDKFIYDAINDQYICPANKILSYTERSTKDGVSFKRYICKDCGDCKQKTKCTNSLRGRSIHRRDDEDIVERIIEKTNTNKDVYKLRKTIVEHPYGTIKRHCGYTYFNRKGLENTNAETSSFCIAYNLKRTINIIGVTKLIEKINRIRDNLSTFSELISKKLFYLIFRKNLEFK